MFKLNWCNIQTNIKKTAKIGYQTILRNNEFLGYFSKINFSTTKHLSINIFSIIPKLNRKIQTIYERSVFVLNVCENHSGLQTEISNIKKEQAELWTAIDEIRKAINYRLPLWATFLISFLFSIIGYLIAMLKFS